jgi:hypothetical protein
MTPVVGYTKLLLEEVDKVGALNATQRQFLNIVLRSAEQSVYWWHLAVEYSQLNCGKYQVEQNRLEWSELVEGISFYLRRHSWIEDFNFEIAPDLPPIVGDMRLVSAFLYLIAPENELRYNPEKVSPFISAQQVDQFRALVSITTELVFINRPEKPKHHDEIFTDGTCYWVAEAILKQYETSVECILSDKDNKTVFKFTLPLWPDDVKKPQ